MQTRLLSPHGRGRASTFRSTSFPIRFASIRRCGREQGDVQWLISLGRLTHQKGFDVLIESFAALASKHPSWRLAIYGEGPDRAQLERLRAESGCEDRIMLPGLVKDSGRGVGQSKPLCAAVAFRGLPQCSSRGACLGLPVIATSCPGGTVEILANGAYGMLVPPDDVAAMTTALDAMLSLPTFATPMPGKRGVRSRLDIAAVSKRCSTSLAGPKG